MRTLRLATHTTVSRCFRALGVSLLLQACAVLSVLAAPRVDYLVPNFGPIAGGDLVVIVGEGFETGATVTIGGVDATDVSVIDGHTMVATTGEVLAAEVAEVVVTNPDTSSGSRQDGFIYIETVYYVDQAVGDDGNDGTSPEQAKRSIQAVLSLYSSATPSDPPVEVRVAEGTYGQNLTIYYQQVLTGGWNSGFTERDPDRYLTVVDGLRYNHVARSFGLGVSPVLDGFTLTNGERVAHSGGFYATDDWVTLSNNVIVANRSGGVGGAFYEWFQDEAATITLRGNVIVGNRAAGRGGAFFFSTYYESQYSHPFDEARPVVDDNVIVGNRGASGGAVSVYPWPEDALGVRMRGNRIADNFASGVGGGLSIFSEGANRVEAEVSNNLLRANESGDLGGGIHLGGTGAVNIDMVSNSLVENVGLFGGTQMFRATQSQATGRLAGHIVRGPNPLFLGGGIDVEYSNVQGGHAGAGNINADPLFFAGPLGGYYLSQMGTGGQGQNQDSPSLDAGEPGSTAAADLLHWVDLRDPLDPVKDRTTRTDHAPDTGVVDQGYHGPGATVAEGLGPTFSLALPPVVSFHGDEWMVLRGTNFESRMAVRFNGLDAAEWMLVSPFIALARPPAMARGALTVEIRNPGPDGTLDTGDDLVASLGGLTVGDTDPPFWTGRVGIQEAEDLAECQAAVGLQWEPADDADSPPVTYDIYRTDVDPFQTSAFLPKPNTLRIDGVVGEWWVDTEVTKNVTYWYIVQARDSSEDPRRDLNYVISSLAGTIPTAAPGDTDAPPRLGDMEVVSVDAGATIDLSWEPVYTGILYRVYRNTDASMIFDPTSEIALLEDQRAAAFTDDVVPEDELLFYQVVAEDECGNYAP
jgi:hypothetical protein